jgi:hypothetical protein
VQAARLSAANGRAYNVGESVQYVKCIDEDGVTQTAVPIWVLMSQTKKYTIDIEYYKDKQLTSALTSVMDAAYPGSSKEIIDCLDSVSRKRKAAATTTHGNQRRHVELGETNFPPLLPTCAIGNNAQLIVPRIKCSNPECPGVPFHGVGYQPYIADDDGAGGKFMLMICSKCDEVIPDSEVRRAIMTTVDESIARYREKKTVCENKDCAGRANGIPGNKCPQSGCRMNLRTAYGRNELLAQQAYLHGLLDVGFYRRMFRSDDNATADVVPYAPDLYQTIIQEMHKVVTASCPGFFVADGKLTSSIDVARREMFAVD